MPSDSEIIESAAAYATATPIPYADNDEHQLRWLIERAFREGRWLSGDDPVGFMAAAKAIVHSDWLEAHDAEVAARALEAAAASIPELMRMNELGMHHMVYTRNLPQASRHMLNGATRFAEHLTDRAKTARALVGHGTPEPTDPEPEKWEYGFYDSADETKTVYWHVFGLTHDTPESAEHTGDKNVFGQTIVVRRRPGSSEWQLHEPSPVPTGGNEHG